MTEKVLGFKGEDIFVFEKNGKKHILVERIGDEIIQGNLAFELVPVVSVEWLEKKLKKEINFHRKQMKRDNICISEWDIRNNNKMILEDLLKAVRLQAVKEKE